MGKKRSKITTHKMYFAEAELDWDGPVRIRFRKDGEEVHVEIPFNAIMGLNSGIKKVINEMQEYVNMVRDTMKA